MSSFGFAVSALAVAPWPTRGRTGLVVTGQSGRSLGRGGLRKHANRCQHV